MTAEFARCAQKKNAKNQHTGHNRPPCFRAVDCGIENLNGPHEGKKLAERALCPAEKKSQKQACEYEIAGCEIACKDLRCVIDFGARRNQHCRMRHRDYRARTGEERPEEDNRLNPPGKSLARYGHWGCGC